MSLAVLTLACSCLLQASESPGKAEYLRCEYRVDPLGVDVPSPRLSWEMRDARRGARQTAYQVLAAGSAETLAADKGDLWDSGKVESDETTAVVYAGKTLAAHARCCWKVRIWDADGKPSAWSQPALWTVGLKDAEWKAEWIGYDKPRQRHEVEAPLEIAKWIWHAGDEPGKVPQARRVFVGKVLLADDAKIDKAELLVAADDECEVVVNKEMVHQWKSSTTAKPIDVTRWLKPGTNELRIRVFNAEGGTAGLIVKLKVRLAGGESQTWVSRNVWQTLDPPDGDWPTRELKPEKLKPVKVLGDYGMKPWGKVMLAEIFTPPPVLLRGEFRVGKPVRRAMLYATGLGIFDLRLNGSAVTDDYFSPGWSDYTKRVYYRAYDVTKSLRQGDNAWGVVLADGWYSGYIGWFGKRDHYGKKPRVRAQLHIEYADGTTEDFATEPTWKAATGETREADFLMGETCDARQAKPGWDLPGFNVGAWAAVDAGAELSPTVQWHPAQPVRAFAEFSEPRSITEPQPGVYVLDIGQNIAGVARLKIEGEAGQKITLRFAERLNPDGTIYTTNLRSARATDTYTCRGGGVEVWQPRFTFHGFQYIEVTGLKSRPQPGTITALALGSDTPNAGRFECSDAMLNRLHKNICFTQRANFIEIPTDCPQRDERLGWTGDAQVYVRTATLNADVQAFFSKWLVDLEDAQRADGQFPMVAPLIVAGADGGAAWADAGVICPWTIYEVYGDRRVLEKHYDAMQRFIGFCTERSTPELLPPAKFHTFGDWLSIKADTPKDVLHTAYFAYSTKLMAKTAAVLGNQGDAAKYEALFGRIKAAFNRAYVAADGRIKGDTQTCYVLALAFDLVDGERAAAAAKHLVEDIEKHDGHLTTGFIGTKDLMLALSKIGRNDVAYRLLHNDTFPSWGFSIKHGATSIWERWDGWTPEKGFQTPGMNSFAHYSFGAVYQWMVENIGGIRGDGPAYKHIILAPQPGGKLTAAKVGYRSIRGEIESDWRQQGDTLAVRVTIPANTTATLMLPAGEGAKISEGGRPAAEAEGVKIVRQQHGQAVYALGAGEYRFEVKRK